MSLGHLSPDAILDSPDLVLEMAQADHLRRLRLSPEEAFVLSRVNRPTPVREVFFGSGLPEQDARTIVRALLEKKALVVSGRLGTTGLRTPGSTRPAAAPRFPGATRPPAAAAPTRPPATRHAPVSPSSRASAGLRKATGRPVGGQSPPLVRPPASSRWTAAVRSPASPTSSTRQEAGTRDSRATAVAPARRSPRIDYGNFAFPEHELNEDVELELEKRKEILFLYYQRESISHFRLLGVSPKASPGEIRKAYLERSKEFHPDTFFRKRLGTYLPKIQDIFNRLRIASETLSDPESRRRYEREGARAFTAEERSALIQREIDQIESEKRSRERRERLLRSRGFVRLTRARELVEEGERHLAEGDDKAALEKFQHALELDPKLEIARERMLAVRREAGSKRATQSIEKAREEARMGRTSAAVALLKAAIELDDTSANARLELAAVLFRAGLDLRDARIHAQRAIALGLSTPKAHRLHGEILLALGMKRNARRELEVAAKQGDARARQLLNGM